MADHKNQEFISGQTLLNEALANHDADIYREDLKARINLIKKSIEHAKNPEGGLPDYKRVHYLGKILKDLEKDFEEVKMRDAHFKNALIFETVEEAVEKMTVSEKNSYFKHLEKLRDSRITQDSSKGMSFIGLFKRIFS